MNETDPPAGFFRLPAAVRRVLGSARQAGKTQLALDAVRAAADAGDWPAALARIQAETEAGNLSPQPVAAVFGRPVPAGVAVSGDAVLALCGLDRVSGVQGPPGQADGTTGPVPSDSPDAGMTGPVPSDSPDAGMTFGVPHRVPVPLPIGAGRALHLLSGSEFARHGDGRWRTAATSTAGWPAVGGVTEAGGAGPTRVLLAGARLTLSGPRYLTLALVATGLPPALPFRLVPGTAADLGGERGSRPTAWSPPADWAWTPDPTAAALVEAALGGDPAAFAAAFDRVHEEARPAEEIADA